MAQIFHYSSNTLVRMSIAGAIFLIGVAGWAVFELDNYSHFTTRQLSPREQPIPFSHKVHAGSLGLACKMCHTNPDPGEGPAQFQGSVSGVWHAPLRLKINLSGGGLDAEAQGTAEP